MTRYYILTRHHGVQVIEASGVDTFHPHTIRFVTAAGTESFDRGELLWWSPLLSSPPAPYAHFENGLPDPVPHSPGAPPPWKTHGHQGPEVPPLPPSPWGNHGAGMIPALGELAFHELSGAAMTALVAAVLPRVPPGWKQVALELKVTYLPPAGRYEIAYRLRNPVTGAEAFDFSDELTAAIEVFHRIHAEGRKYWNGSILTLHREVTGPCRTEAKFNYGRNFGPR